MRKCRFCHADIDDAARVCVHCGRDLFPHADPPASVAARSPVSTPPPSAPPDIARVSVVDINMPFASMVGFMVKWSIAAIPAIIILAAIGALVVGVLAGL